MPDDLFAHFFWALVALGYLLMGNGLYHALKVAAW